MKFKEHIHNLEKSLFNPEVRSSTSELEQMLAEGFFEFGSSANIWFREDCLESGGVEIRE